MQFMQVPMNLLDENGLAAICDNGVWGNKAVKEASIFGPVKVVSDTSDKKHTYLNKTLAIPSNTTYVHITTNNTVEGTQWHSYPQTNALLVGDMSSDIFCRPTPFKQFDLIYAGAQKNMGAAGVTLVVVKKEILGKVKRKIPAILDYQKHIEAGSLLNTPPVFSIYVSLLTLRWIEQQGGLVEMGKRNQEKADLLYQYIDQSSLYENRVVKEYRSRMNVTFFLKDENLNAEFLAQSNAAGLVALRGHKAAGGMRASIYNAMPIEGVKALVEFMRDFERRA